MKNLKNTSKIEILKKPTKQLENKGRGGYRPGSGTKPGAKLKRTIERDDALKIYRERVVKHADELFNAQLANAKGNTYIYEVVEIEIGGGKTRKKHELVTDPQKILQVLDQNQGNSGEVEGGYFIVTIEKPDNVAIKDMMDRTYGTATQKQEITGKDGQPIQTSSVFSTIDQETLKSLPAEELEILKKSTEIQFKLTNSKN